MGQFGRQYFYMMTDEEYQAEWYRLANVTPPLMPIDEAGRLRLIRTSSHPNAVGSDSLRIMLEDYDGRTFGAREEVTKATIEAFVAKHLNPFDELKAKLLCVGLSATNSFSFSLRHPYSVNLLQTCWASRDPSKMIWLYF